MKFWFENPAEKMKSFAKYLNIISLIIAICLALL